MGGRQDLARPRRGRRVIRRGDRRCLLRPDGVDGGDRDRRRLRDGARERHRDPNRSDERGAKERDLGRDEQRLQPRWIGQRPRDDRARPIERRKVRRRPGHARRPAHRARMLGGSHAERMHRRSPPSELRDAPVASDPDLPRAVVRRDAMSREPDLRQRAMRGVGRLERVRRRCLRARRRSTDDELVVVVVFVIVRERRRCARLGREQRRK